MKVQSLIIVAIAALYVLLPGGPACSAEKPAPPEGLISIFGEMGELEEKFESGKWDEVGETVAELKEIIEKIAPDLAAVESISGTDEKMMLAIEKLEKAVSGKDLDMTHKFYVALQKMMIETMDAFAFKVPPSLSLIESYIDESREALERKDYDDIGREMDEIGEFFEKSEAALEDAGIGEEKRKSFQQNLIDIRGALAKKQYEDLDSLFDNLAALAGEFKAAF